MNNEELVGLVDKMNNGAITDQELAIFSQGMNSLLLREEFDQIDDSIKEKLWERIQKERDGGRNIFLRGIIFRWSIAASVLLAFSLGYVLFFKSSPNEYSNVITDREYLPKKSFLSVELPSGKVLSGKTEAELQDAGVFEVRQANGVTNVFIHEDRRTSRDDYKILTTSSGGLFSIKLDDGTKIYLNANTRIKLPAYFSKSRREVELLSGEAFFEVTHNPLWPFSVKIRETTINDLGTSFLLTTMNDKITTILQTGKLNIRTPKGHLELSPGKGASIGGDGMISKPFEGNADDFTDWKDGIFRFEDDELRSVMKRISDWYGVEITWSDSKIANKRFFGVIDRKKELSEVLQMISITSGTSFEVKSKQITVK